MGFPNANRSHCLKITILLCPNSNRSRSDQLPPLRSSAALCLRDLRGEEPRNSHPHIQTPVAWTCCSVPPSGQRPPSAGDQVPGRTPLQLFWLEHPNFSCGTPDARSQGDLVSPQDGKRMCLGSGGTAGLPELLCRHISLATSSHKHCKGATPGLLRSSVLSHLCPPNTFPLPLLFFTLPFPPEITSERLQNRLRG